MNTVKNPILSGFHPDPSICFAKGKFYIVTSTFSYFPGVPIYESEDLQNFKLIGNILDRKEQLPLMGGKYSGGIFAPTIRYNEKNDKFYMITTNVTKDGNFVVTADKPEGPWSNPYWIKDAEGIDPSLFFDDDGSCYYIGTRPNPEGVGYNGDWYIYIQKFDVDEMKLVGDYKIVWNGALKNAIWPEGPHLYKKDGYYYILHAEGGTGPNHAISVARSKEVFGPYEGNSNNPIFTHRHLGKDYPVQNVGHSDLVMTPEGTWYAVMLGTRPVAGYTSLGRETFLADVIWEDGWPVYNPGEGKLYEKHKVGLKRSSQINLKNNNLVHFNSNTLDSRIIGIRLVDESIYSLTAHKDYLRLYMKDMKLTQKENPSYLAIRQLHHSFTAETMTDICFDRDGDGAGLAIVQSDCSNVQFLCKYEGDAICLSMIIVRPETEATVKTEKLNLPQGFSKENVRIFFKIQKISDVITLMYAFENSEYSIFSEVKDDFLNTEVSGGFVGCTLGMYAVSENGSAGYADYSWLSYDGIEI